MVLCSEFVVFSVCICVSMLNCIDTKQQLLLAAVDGTHTINSQDDESRLCTHILCVRCVYPGKLAFHTNANIFLSILCVHFTPYKTVEENCYTSNRIITFGSGLFENWKRYFWAKSENWKHLNGSALAFCCIRRWFFGIQMESRNISETFFLHSKQHLENK